MRKLVFAEYRSSTREGGRPLHLGACTTSTSGSASITACGRLLLAGPAQRQLTKRGFQMLRVFVTCEIWAMGLKDIDQCDPGSSSLCESFLQYNALFWVMHVSAGEILTFMSGRQHASTSSSKLVHYLVVCGRIN